MAESPSIPFNPTVFFDGFTSYLQNQRAGAVRYACVCSSPEHWFQIEAMCWLNSNREKVGLAGGDFLVPDWEVLFEKRKVDLWLQHRATSNERHGRLAVWWLCEQLPINRGAVWRLVGHALTE